MLPVDPQGVARNEGCASVLALERHRESIQAVVRGCHERQAGAHARLLDHVLPQINRIVWAILGGDIDHDDMVQETALKVVRGVDQIRDAALLAAWVRTVTLNTVRSHLRRRRLLRAIFPVDLAAEPPAPLSDDPAPVGLRRSLYQALAGLPTRERMAFCLRHVEEYSRDEVATALGCSARTTKRLLERAVTRLRSFCAGDASVCEHLEGTES